MRIDTRLPKRERLQADDKFIGSKIDLKRQATRLRQVITCFAVRRQAASSAGERAARPEGIALRDLPPAGRLA